MKKMKETLITKIKKVKKQYQRELEDLKERIEILEERIKSCDWYINDIEKSQLDERTCRILERLLSCVDFNFGISLKGTWDGRFKKNFGK